jgi:hypothetical protein
LVELLPARGQEASPGWEQTGAKDKKYLHAMMLFALACPRGGNTLRHLVIGLFL